MHGFSEIKHKKITCKTKNKKKITPSLRWVHRTLYRNVSKWYNYKMLKLLKAQNCKKIRRLRTKKEKSVTSTPSLTLSAP